MIARTRFRTVAGAGAALIIAIFAIGLVAVPRGLDAQTAAPPAAPGVPLTPAPGAPAQEPGGGIVATVDGEPITEQDLDIAYDEFQDQLGNFSIDQKRQVAIDLLIHIRLLAKSAAAQGVDKEPAMVEKLRLVHDRALYTELLNRLFDKEVTEDKARALFADQQAKAGPAFEYHVRHILVPTEAEAKDVINKLNSGGDFAQLAKDVSIDSGSAPDGGDLGFLAAGDTVKEFETAAFALKVGEYTKTPVESQFGFHVIQLQETRDAAPKTFEDSIPQLQDELAQNAFQKVIDDLTAQAKITKAPAPGQQPNPATQPSAGGAAPATPAAPR